MAANEQLTIREELERKGVTYDELHSVYALLLRERDEKNENHEYARMFRGH